MQTDSDPTQIGRIHSFYEEIVGSADYHHYSHDRPAIDARFTSLVPQIVESLRPETASFAASRQRYLGLQKIKNAPLTPVASVAFFVLVAGVVGLFAALGNAGLMSTVSPLGYLGLVVAVIALSVGALGVLLSYMRRRSLISTARLGFEVAKKEAFQKTKALVEEAFTRSMNEVLGPKGLLGFRTIAPRLVELSTSEVVPSRSFTALKEFILGHASSAVGIAGPRGSGKSALLRGLEHDEAINPHVVTMTAPVKYEPTDFIRRLYSDVAEKVEAQNGYSSQRLGDERLRWHNALRALFGIGVVIGGGLLILFDITPPESSLETKAELSLTGLLGVGLSVFGALILISSSNVSPLSVLFRTTAASSSTATRLAANALQRLKYDTETSAKSKSGTKLPSGWLSWELEDGLTLKDRAQSHPDLVKGLRELLTAFAAESAERPVIIMIDELDKLSLTEDLIETVNGLKDLFHIEGVHFVVTVSTDALRSFEQRGLPSRDAFDSSFDTIFAVQPLTLEEALGVLSSRAEGFPPPIGAFCHAWAGGLPRDLLRAARRCVELQRSHNGPLPLDTFVRTVVFEDLRAIIAGRLGKSNISDADRAALSHLHRRANQLGSEAPVQNQQRTSALRNRRFRIGSRRAELSLLSQEVDIITSVLKLAEGLVQYASNSGRHTPSGWDTTDEARATFESAARAMACRAEPQEIRQEAFETAFARLYV